ncbi:unnamed protein product [Heligmosomoides polygyrus]|uniref:DUF148 domain-containing protein n=1 Tax=Heligmosomoides polygyrus TaxID=6339 RepID=A0A183GKS0_HELPZ|nr:unnamed protein product [Heligmosomoides polygyrus]
MTFLQLCLLPLCAGSMSSFGTALPLNAPPWPRLVLSSDRNGYGNPYSLDTGSMSESAASTVPKVLVHHAIVLESEEGLGRQLPCTDSWNVHPNPIGVTDPNAVVVQPRPEPVIPLEVVVHWLSGDGEAVQDSTDRIASVTANLDRPAFLIDVPEDVARRYLEITHNQSLTKGEAKNALDQWKSTLSEDMSRKYEQEQSEKEQTLTVERKRQSEATAALNPTARQVAEQIEALRANDNLTIMEEQRLIQDVMQNIPPELRQQLAASSLIDF